MDFAKALEEPFCSRIRVCLRSFPNSREERNLKGSIFHLIVVFSTYLDRLFDLHREFGLWHNLLLMLQQLGSFHGNEEGKFSLKEVRFYGVERWDFQKPKRSPI